MLTMFASAVILPCQLQQRNEQAYVTCPFGPLPLCTAWVTVFYRNSPGSNNIRGIRLAEELVSQIGHKSP